MCYIYLCAPLGLLCCLVLSYGRMIVNRYSKSISFDTQDKLCCKSQPRRIHAGGMVEADGPGSPLLSPQFTSSFSSRKRSRLEKGYRRSFAANVPLGCGSQPLVCIGIAWKACSTRVLGPTLSFWFCRSGVGPKGLHFKWVPGTGNTAGPGTPLGNRSGSLKGKKNGEDGVRRKEEDDGGRGRGDVTAACRWRFGTRPSPEIHAWFFFSSIWASYFLREQYLFGGGSRGT